MKYRAFEKGWLASQRALRWLIVLSACLGAAVLCLVVLLVTQKETIVLVPPVMDGEMRIRAGDPTPEFREMWAVFVATQIGNVSPKTVGFAKKTLEQLVSPEIFHSMSEVVEEQIRRIQLERLVLRFEPREVLYDQGSGRVFVNGIGHVTTPSGVSERRRKTFEVLVDATGYSPVVQDLRVHEGEESIAERRRELEGS